MAGLAPVELLADCPACGLEGGVVEVYDARVAACRFGLPAAQRCRLCGGASQGAFDGTPARALEEIPANRCPSCVRELGPSAIDERRCPHCGARAALVEARAPARFTSIAELELALETWAERERFPSRDALVRATFVETDVARLFAMIRSGEALEALADPFANMGVRKTGGGEEGAREPAPLEPVDMEPTPRGPAIEAHREAPPEPPAALVSPMSVTPPPSAPPRALVFPLVSVIAADGEIHPEERALVDRFLVGEGLAPLADHEFAVHHPSAVAHLVPPERREEVVRLMCETAAIDGLPDESERRVICAYATAWQVDDEKLDFWIWSYENMSTSLARQLFLKLRRFVLSARWGQAEE
jgi:uncharacterized tellurite resistance protein B-like protein